MLTLKRTWYYLIEAYAYSDGTLMDEVVQLMLSVSAAAPEDIDVQVVLGVIYNISMDYELAAECFRKAVALSQSPTSQRSSTYSTYNLLNKLAATLANSNNSAEAIPLYSKVLQQRPKFARGWMNLGISYANLGEYQEAAKAYTQALHLSPDAK